MVWILCDPGSWQLKTVCKYMLLISISFKVSAPFDTGQGNFCNIFKVLIHIIDVTLDVCCFNINSFACQSTGGQSLWFV